MEKIPLFLVYYLMALFGKMHLAFKTTCIDILQENKRNLFYTTGGGRDQTRARQRICILTFFVQSIPRCYKDTCIFLLFSAECIVMLTGYHIHLYTIHWTDKLAFHLARYYIPLKQLIIKSRNGRQMMLYVIEKKNSNI